jgi:hypothetical protein
MWESDGWPCPRCGRLLRTAHMSLKLTWAITLVISTGMCLYFGLRGSAAVVVSLIASVPLSFIVHAVIGLFSSVPLELFPDQEDPGNEGSGKSS